MTKYDLDKYLTETDEIIAHTIRLPKSLKDRLEKLATKRVVNDKKGVSFNAFVVAGLSAVCDEEDGKLKK